MNQDLELLPEERTALQALHDGKAPAQGDTLARLLLERLAARGLAEELTYVYDPETEKGPRDINLLHQAIERLAETGRFPDGFATSLCDRLFREIFVRDG